MEDPSIDLDLIDGDGMSVMDIFHEFCPNHSNMSNLLQQNNPSENEQES